MKINKSQIVFKLIFLALIFFYRPVLEGEKREFRVAIDSWPPFRMIEDSTYTGIDFDLWREVASRLDLKLVFIESPWARCLFHMKEGFVDGMIGLAKRAEREEYMYYTNPPYYKCSTVFYVLKGESDLIQEYNDLYKYTIGFVRGSAYFKKFDDDTKLLKHPRLKEVQLIKLLAHKRIDTFIGTDSQADYQIIQEGYNGMFEKAVYKPNNDVDLYMAISKKSDFAKELSKFNKVIKQILDEGKVKEFSREYYR